MKTLLDMLAVGGGILGIISFLWRIWDEFGSYLFLGMEIRTDVPGYAVAAVRVENSGHQRKSLSAAFLLVGPFAEHPVQTYNKIAIKAGLSEVRYTNDILRSDASQTIVIDKGIRQLIPLSFLTRENVAVGDEKLACSIPLKLEAAHYEGPHSVRLLVGADAKWIPRLHRSVHDIILLDPASRRPLRPGSKRRMHSATGMHALAAPCCGSQIRSQMTSSLTIAIALASTAGGTTFTGALCLPLRPLRAFQYASRSPARRVVAVGGAAVAGHGHTDGDDADSHPPGPR